MPDIRQSSEPGPGELFRSTLGTSLIAGAQAARKSRGWKAKIVARLAARPSAIWEVAEYFGVPDHCISGRFSELAGDGKIEITGERRNRPVSNCPAEVWRVCKEAM